MRFTSSVLKRTGTMRPLASPLGSFGRPIFGLVCFAMFSELLNDYRLHGRLRRKDGWDMKYRHVASGSCWIVRRVYPSVDLIRLGMPSQTKDLDNAIPYRLALEFLDY